MSLEGIDLLYGTVCMVLMKFLQISLWWVAALGFVPILATISTFLSLSFFPLKREVWSSFPACFVGWSWVSLVAQLVKNLPVNAGDTRDVGLILGQEDPLEKEMATHSSLGNSMDREAWWTSEVYGVAENWIWSSAHTHTYTHKRGWAKGRAVKILLGFHRSSGPTSICSLPCKIFAALRPVQESGVSACFSYSQQHLWRPDWLIYTRTHSLSCCRKFLNM